MEAGESGATAFAFTESTILELTGESHLGDVDSLLLRGRGMKSLTGLASLNLPNLQVTLYHQHSVCYFGSGSGLVV